MLPGGINLEPGEVLVKQSTLRWADPPVIPASPFTESHIILTNQRIIMLGETHHEYRTFVIPLSEVNRVEVKDVKGFPGAGIVRVFAGPTVVIEYREQSKIKILRIGVNDAQSVVESIHQSLQGAVGPAQAAAPFSRANAGESATIFCTSCGHRLQTNARYCPDCGKPVELP
jgi:hypothetical protein